MNIVCSESHFSFSFQNFNKIIIIIIIILFKILDARAPTIGLAQGPHIPKSGTDYTTYEPDQ